MSRVENNGYYNCPKCHGDIGRENSSSGRENTPIPSRSSFLELKVPWTRHHKQGKEVSERWKEVGKIKDLRI